LNPIPQYYDIVDAVRDQQQFLDLAISLGDIVPTSNGELIQQLRTKDKKEAKPNPLSSKYGMGAFPMHTDTAFHHTPAKCILLRAAGEDFERETTILTFDSLFENAEDDFEADFLRSRWLVSKVYKPFYVSGSINNMGWRYDSECMKPLALSVADSRA